MNMARLINNKERRIEVTESSKLVVDKTAAVDRMVPYLTSNFKKKRNGQPSGDKMDASTAKCRTKYARRIVNEYGLEWTPEWVEHVRKSIEDITLELGEPSRDGMIKPKTARTMLYSVEDLFRANGVLIDGKPLKIAKPDGQFEEDWFDRQDEFHTKDEVDRLLAAASVDQRDGPMLYFAWYTGARPTEYLKLKRYQLDLDRGIVKLAGFKTNTLRTVVLPGSMVKMLRDYLAFRDEHEVGCAKYPLVFLNSQNGDRPLGISALEWLWNGYAKKADIVSNPYMMRHSRASYLLNVKKWTPAQVSAVTGHSIATLNRWYNHINEQQMRGLLVAIGED
jgi:integrase